MRRIFEVLGVPVHAIDLPAAVTTICDLAANGDRSGRAAYVCVRDVNGIVASRRDARLLAVHRQAAMVTPDGMPVVWWGRLHGYRETKRVYGPDLMVETCRASPASALKHYLCGGTEHVAEELQHRLQTRCPAVDIVGTWTPPFRALGPDEYRALAGRIESCAANVIWVGLSSPKQELFMHDLSRYLNGGVLIGVGAAFDFLSGRKPQAPRWMQRNGFEWLFRLCTEPRRLGRRYLVMNSLFLILTTQYIAGRLGQLGWHWMVGRSSR